MCYFGIDITDCYPFTIASPAAYLLCSWSKLSVEALRLKLSDIHLLLCEARQEQKISQKEVAAALNVEQATISMYENGKRGIPLDLLDEWLRILEIEVKITPKGLKPVQSEKEIKDALEVFNRTKKRRNYLIAELRALTSEKILQQPDFTATNEETGEGVFWPYSFYGDCCVGLVETRYDHPQQKYMAVEYTGNEVNVYKFHSIKETYDGRSNPEWLNADRLFFTEDDFLTIGGAWEQEFMDAHQITILKKNTDLPDGVEIVETGGFSARSLLQMQENFCALLKALDEVEATDEYQKMERDLDSVHDQLGDISLNNRLQNNALNPEFFYWDEEDKAAIDIPLWNPRRNWYWIEEGGEWTEDFQEAQEVRLTGDEVEHELLHTHRHENGNRVIGLIGEDQKPALFKSSPSRPNIVYRAEIDVERLNEKELADYHALLKATEDLRRLRGDSGSTNQ